jgi:hypothetical protein
MAEVPQPIDLWSVLDEAEQTVEHWPEWQQRYDADVYCEVRAAVSGSEQDRDG